MAKVIQIIMIPFSANLQRFDIAISCFIKIQDGLTFLMLAYPRLY